MDNSVAKDMDWSSEIFAAHVWPMIRDQLGGGDLLQMENRPDIELARLLDMQAGIDGWQVHHDGMRGIAARIQSEKEWRTFTIRASRDSGAKTEYEKRVTAIYGPDAWMYPAITLQAYRIVNNEGLVFSVGAAKTVDVFDFIKRGLHGHNRTNNATFFIVPWDAKGQHGTNAKSNLVDEGYELSQCRKVQLL